MKNLMLILIFLIINTSVFSQELCRVVINESELDERTVLLMGGKAWDLFKAYINELKKRNIDFDLDDIKVKVWDGRELKTEEISVFNLFTGEGPMKIWKNKLKSLYARYNEYILQEAYSLGWDIFCIQRKKVVKKDEENKEKVKEEKEKLKKGTCLPEAEVHINLGIQFVQTKNLDNALREFKTAVQKSPTCPLAYANLANLYLLKKDYNFALDTYKEGVKNAGDDPFLHYTGAVIYTKRGDYDYALQALEKALKSGFRDINILKKDKDLLPLKKRKQKEFCELMLKYNIPLRECL